MNTLVNCPHCKKEVTWNKTSEYRPFCSERCKMQDLGAWFMEERSIEGEIDPLAFELGQNQNNKNNSN